MMNEQVVVLFTIDPTVILSGVTDEDEEIDVRWVDPREKAFGWDDAHTMTFDQGDPP